MATNGKTLDLAALESWLWEAACIVRGSLDGPARLHERRREPAAVRPGDGDSHLETDRSHTT